MGVSFSLIQISESRLMHLSEADASNLVDEIQYIEFNDIEALSRYEFSQVPHLAGLDLSLGEPRLPVPGLYLGKGWWEIHFFLTGKDGVDHSSLLSRSILGGKQIGSTWHLWAEEVREISEAYAALNRDELRKWFDDPAGHIRTGHDCYMEKVFRDETLDDAFFNTAIDFIGMLAAYYRIAAKRGNAMLGRFS